MSPVEEPHRLSRAEARRIAVRAQRLTADRPAGVLETVQALSHLVLDPTSAIAPTADLVLWSRLGSSYSRAELRDLADELRLVELGGVLRLAEDLAPYRAEMAAWAAGEHQPDSQAATLQWLEDNGGCRHDVLELLRSDGPLTAAALPDTCVRPWRSSGWNNSRNITMMLDVLARAGVVAVAGREGRHKLWDLAERIYPDDPVPALEEARRQRDVRRLGVLGIARPSVSATSGEPVDVHEAGEPAVVEGVRGDWRVDPAQLDRPFAGRAALLSPFDALVYHRKRTTDLFAFEYALEMYKPVDERRWGYYALPVLVGDRLVGKLDATAERAEGVLRVRALHQDEPFDDTTRAAVHAEVEDLARWLDLDLDHAPDGAAP